jgi:predicted DNA repair protein MutK
VAVLVGIALLMTVGVYRLVGGIVKLDDFGLHLTRRASAAAQAIGRGILRAAPWLMKFLSVAGTAAMFLVGGHILVEGIPPLHHLAEAWVAGAGALGWLVSMLVDAVVGIAAGAIVLGGVLLAKRVFPRRAAQA